MKKQTIAANSVQKPKRKYGPLGEDFRKSGAVSAMVKLTSQFDSCSTAQTFARRRVGMISQE
jgi:hypothetical protein